MIQQLPESLVNQIAAGEVIVRPASAVKELVENSLDAQATHVTVELSNGCRDIRVTDDGVGMDRQDASMALVRHATSKITRFEDLYELDTRGFRGEALASMAAVSRMSLVTRPRGAVAGTRVLAEGPGAPRVEPAGAPEGTDIRLRDLFHNVPARLKFLKSPSAELQATVAMITRLAIARPDVGFTVIGNGETLLNLPSKQEWPQRIAALLGGTPILDNLLTVEGDRHGVHIRGYVVKPSISRKDRRHQHFHVNGRPITSRALSQVLQEAYRGVIMVGRFPLAVLDIAVPPSEVDVNVHPTKEEVRFRQESAVQGAVYRLVQGALRAANLMPVADLGDQRPEPSLVAGVGPLGVAPQPDFLAAPNRPTISSASPFAPVRPADPAALDLSAWSAPGVSVPASDTAAWTRAMQTVSATLAVDQAEAQWRAVDPLDSSATVPSGGVATDFNATEHHCDVRPITQSLRQQPPDSWTADNTGGLAGLVRNGLMPEPLGQVADCYIIARVGHDLLLVDQHAAHERLMYMQLREGRQSPPVQPLLVPVAIDVPPDALTFITRLLPVLENLGLKVEPFGGSTFLVQTVPADLKKLDPAAVVADLLDDWRTLGRTEEVEAIRDRAITRMACRAAIKAGQKLHHDEMRALLHDLAESQLGFTCPHGRPTMILLTRDQLDRQFRRKL